MEQAQKSIYDMAQETSNFLNTKTKHKPTIGLILGSGLGDFADQLENKDYIPFEDIPFFKKPTIIGHAGKLVFGTWTGKVVIAMQGRYHFCEGHTIQEVVFPVRVMKILGVQDLIITNAAGGINSMLNAGDLMIIKDHINLLGTNPLIGPNEDKFGTRFPDMTNIYNEGMRNKIKDTMNKVGFAIKEGVYVAFTGPSYETPAEIKMAKSVGGDAVGMSTVPEAIVANHMGINVAGISCICSMASGISQQPLTHKEVIETADKVKEKFKQLIGDLIKAI